MNQPGITTGSALTPVSATDLFQYPFTAADRLDSHWFVPWERRRWLNSDMRLRGTPECRAIYFDLILIAFDQSPIGTLPHDMALLAKLVHMPADHFSALCELRFGPLHKWEPCQCEGEIRLMHWMVLQTLTDAVSRREDNRARMEAANRQKRLQRLRATVLCIHKDLGANDAAIRWMDDWFLDQDVTYRSTAWVEKAIMAWSNHVVDLAHKPLNVRDCPADSSRQSADSSRTVFSKKD